jgi:hypothetical protein
MEQHLSSRDCFLSVLTIHRIDQLVASESEWNQISFAENNGEFESRSINDKANTSPCVPRHILIQYEKAHAFSIINLIQAAVRCTFNQ